MTPRLLSRAWIFVSHSTKDLSKVRSVRNQLERAGAEPLIFRLKFLDQKKSAIPVLLKAEIRARQFFLLCRSQNSRASAWVQKEIGYVNTLPNKSKFVIDLDATSYGRAGLIGSVLRRVTIIVAYSWADRLQTLNIVRQLTTLGVPQPALDEGPTVYDEFGEEVPADPYTIDHGIRGLDDRARKDGRSWEDAALAASESGEVFVLLLTRALLRSTGALERVEVLKRIRSGYNDCYVLDLDRQLARRPGRSVFAAAEWSVLAGTLEHQLQQLVHELRLRETRSDPEWPTDVSEVD